MKQGYLHFMLVFVLLVSIAMSSCTPAPPVTEPIITVPAEATATTAPVEPTTTAAPTSTIEPTATSAPKEPISYANSQKYSITYTVIIQNKGFTPTDIRLYLPLPSEWDAQKDLKINQISPEPKSQQAEEKSGNTMIYWQLNGFPKNGTTEKFTLDFDLTAYEINTNIDPSTVQPYNIDSAVYKFYTKAENYVESADPKIIELADHIVGDETNPYFQAQRFYNYIIQNVDYEILGQGLNGAKYVLDNKIGECGDYSALFIALCRAKGIPARSVVGFWAISGKKQTHVWAEFYLEGIGWIPVDATIGQQSSTKRDYYFGNMDNQRVILSKGYNTALIPAGPDGFIAPILQVPFFWFWGSGDANKLSLLYNWTVREIQ